MAIKCEGLLWSDNWQLKFKFTKLKLIINKLQSYNLML